MPEQENAKVFTVGMSSCGAAPAKRGHRHSASAARKPVSVHFHRLFMASSPFLQRVHRGDQISGGYGSIEKCVDAAILSGARRPDAPAPGRCFRRRAARTCTPESSRSGGRSGSRRLSSVYALRRLTSISRISAGMAAHRESASPVRPGRICSTRNSRVSVSAWAIASDRSVFCMLTTMFFHVTSPLHTQCIRRTRIAHPPFGYFLTLKSADSAQMGRACAFFCKESA